MKSKLAVLVTTMLCLAVIAATPLAAYERGEKIDVQIPYDLDSLMQEAGPNNTEADNLWQIWGSVARMQLLPQWNADGNIYFMGFVDGLFRVPAIGGMAELLQPAPDEIPDLTFVTRPRFQSPSVAPNSTMLYFQKDQNSVSTIESFDLETEEAATFAEGGYPEISRSETYLAYRGPMDGERKSDLILRNLETGVETVLDNGQFYGHCFTPDESTIIYSKAVDENNYQLFSIPVTGGDPVQLTTYEGGLLGMVRSHPQVHPDGNLIVYTDRNYDEEYREILTYTHGSGGGTTTWSPSQLAVFNMTTGQTMYMLEYDDDPGTTFGEKCGYFRSRYGVFSPDGSQICYCGEDTYNRGEDGSQAPEELYIFDFVTAKYAGTTAVENDAPESFMTVENFPNPFNPTTTISFTIPEAGFTEVSIFNITGQKVRTLVAGELPAGTHQLAWDGRDDQSDPVSSGVFVSQLSSGGNVVTNRMTLVR